MLNFQDIAKITVEAVQENQEGNTQIKLLLFFFNFLKLNHQDKHTA